ncbi:extracellular solute-binding protein [uncultured Methylobacterium sp.]|jgi:multiple sugar transport system substrate-binding protein|uniref:extracellular solute-binding protein n=1 Tax=uncultured Methylobacterium sp. TaxID=157278 RepID=UPI00262CABFF|nr:extracellular solute-binding protein [uncultured Methylobacterium sp.]
MGSGNAIARRRLLAAGGSAALAAGLSLRPRPARAEPRTLRIMQWRHFIPGYDRWFKEVFAKEWGEANDTTVIVDSVGYGDITRQALEEIRAQRGHDLVQFVTPHAMYLDHLVDHREVFEECRRRYGAPHDFAVRAHYNPRTRSHVGFAAVFQPALVNDRKDLWDGIRAVPDRWDDVLTGGRRIKLVTGRPLGLSLAAEHNGEQTLRSILYSFGAHEQTAEGAVALKSRETLDALAYVKALYEQAMIPDVLTWDGASNNRFMLTGEGSFTVDSLSILRAADAMGLPFAEDLRLSAMPAGPAARLGSFGFYTYAIWTFAENQDGARRFLADLAGRSREALIASGLQNMPCYPGTVPDLAALAAGQGARYAVMPQVPGWTTNVGHPGYTNPAIAEIYARGVVSRMFSAVATGRETPEEAAERAHGEAAAIVEGWRERGKV